MNAEQLEPQEPPVLDLADLLLRVHRERKRLQAIEAGLTGDLFETIGREMIAAGRATRVVGRLKFHVREPRLKEYCFCHRTLVYQCPTPLPERAPYIAILDALPDFFITEVAE